MRSIYSIVVVSLFFSDGPGNFFVLKLPQNVRAGGEKREVGFFHSVFSWLT